MHSLQNVQYVGRNLMQNTSDEWSPWIEMPKNRYNAYHPSFFFTINIEEEGPYVVYYQIELRNVDVDWDAVERDEMTLNGIFWSYEGGDINEALLSRKARVSVHKGEEFNCVHTALGISMHPRLGEHKMTFGCHHFNSGEMRIRRLKVARWLNPFPWTPTIESNKLEFIEPNLVNGTSEEWSNWITPQYNRNNATGYFYRDVYVDYFPETGKLYSGVEIEFKDVTFTPEDIIMESDTENKTPGFSVQGAILDDNGEHCWFITEDGNLSVEKTTISIVYVHPFVSATLNLYHETESEIVKGKRTIDLKKELERYPGVIGKRPINIGYRANWWATGQFRYRKVFIKSGDIPNPIYSKSEMDAANPNLITNFSLYNSYRDDNGIHADAEYSDTYGAHEIAVKDAPNPYINTGWRCYNDLSVRNTMTLIGHYAVKPGKTYTISLYARTLSERTRFRFDCWCSSGTENPESSQSFWNGDVYLNKEWTRYTLTVTTPEYTTYSDFHYTFVGEMDAEVCGAKIEEGDKATAWVPYGATTLELEGEEIHWQEEEEHEI